MKKQLKALILVAILAVVSEAQDSLNYGPFGNVYLYRPSSKPSEIVLFFSGDGGWNLGVIKMAVKLQSMGALVVGINTVRYLKNVENNSDKCVYTAGDIEMLSKTVQKKERFTHYITPILAGYSSGATLTYIALAQAPRSEFKGGLSLGFCPDLPTVKPFCKGSGLTWEPGQKGKGINVLPNAQLQIPWYVINGEMDQVCPLQPTKKFIQKIGSAQIVVLPKVGHGYSVEKNWLPSFVKVYNELTKKEILPKNAEEVSVPGADLPLVKVPAKEGTKSDFLALEWTGDGGWGVTDNGMAESLAEKGIPTLGFNSLKYFWNKRTPEETASDCSKALVYYMREWNRNQVILIGYSFGADIAPFIVNNLSSEMRGTIKLLVLISPSPYADFEFNFASWFGGQTKNARPVLPEVKKLKDVKILCFYGKNDKESLGPELEGMAKLVPLETGHRVGNNFDPIVNEILNSVAE